MSRLWLYWRDLFSFELLFLLFVTAAAYKSAPLLATINERHDLTLLTAVAGGVCGIFVFLSPNGVMPRARAWGFLSIYLLYVSCALATYFHGGIFSDNANLKVQKLLVFNSWSILAPLFIINTRERIERFLRLLFSSIVFMTLYAAVNTQVSGPSRFVGTFGTDSYQLLGVLAAMGIEMILVAMLLAKHQRAYVRLGVAGGVMGLTMVLAGARQALAGLLVVGVFLIYTLYRSSKTTRLLTRYGPAIGLVVILFLVLKSHVFSDVGTEWGTSRLLGAFASINETPIEGESRPMLWSSGLRVWMAHPILGAGFGSFSEVGDFPDARQPHNLFVEMLCDMGIVGLCVGCALWAYPLRSALRGIRRNSDPVLLTLTALWLHNLTCACFSGDVTDNRIMFLFAALMVSQAAIPSATKATPQSYTLPQRLVRVRERPTRCPN